MSFPTIKGMRQNLGVPGGMPKTEENSPEKRFSAMKAAISQRRRGMVAKTKLANQNVDPQYLNKLNSKPIDSIEDLGSE
jgi:hypothetical protein